MRASDSPRTRKSSPSQLHAPRYSTRPFPAYAFLPGADPHPTADPAGHSHGIERPAPLRHPPEAWANDVDYLYGCDLFNHGYWWEAHEAWEGIWLLCPAGSQQARFLQALIQAANALLKHRMGRPRAVRRLVAETGRHVEAVGRGRYMGLDVGAWYEGFERYALTLPAGELPAQEFPCLRLNMSSE